MWKSIGKYDFQNNHKPILCRTRISRKKRKTFFGNFCVQENAVHSLQNVKRFYRSNRLVKSNNRTNQSPATLCKLNLAFFLLFFFFNILGFSIVAPLLHLKNDLHGIRFEQRTKPASNQLSNIIYGVLVCMCADSTT